MPSQMEFEGKDVESAVEKASKKLNIPADKLKYAVISYGSTGIFGLVGVKKARIRVNATHSATKRTRKPRGGSAQPLQPPAVAPPELALRAAESEPDARISEPAPSDTVAETAGDDAVGTESPAAIDSADATPAAVPTEDDNTIEPGAPKIDDAALQAGRDALQRIVDAISDGAAISVETIGERIRFDISTEESAILIGKRGQTLDAMQYVVEKIVNLRNKERIRVQVDVEGYLENRKDNLRQMAERLAEKVKRSGKPTSAGQLNAHDRRIIHMALKADEGVRTQSIGEGLYRKLMIFPKKSTQKKKPD